MPLPAFIPMMGSILGQAGGAAGHVGSIAGAIGSVGNLLGLGPKDRSHQNAREGRMFEDAQYWQRRQADFETYNMERLHSRRRS